MKKRFLCLVLALFLFASLLPTTVLADGSSEKPDAKFDFILNGSEKPEDTDAALVMKAGEEAKYYTTKQSDPNLPNNWFLAPSTDAEWNVKFEYPADGIPTITLKDAKINNVYGLWFGGVNIPMTGDVKLVLEGNNQISGDETSGTLCFATTGTTTVTGSGKLEYVSDAHSQKSALLLANGDIILDNVNIMMQMPETKGKTNGIRTNGGDVTMKGGSLTIVAYDNPKTLHDPGTDTGYRCNQEAIHSAVFVKKRADGTGGNFTVQDGAQILIMASPSVNKDNNGILMYTEGTFTIKNSSVEIGLIGKIPTGVSIFDKKPTLEYKDDTYSIIATRSKYPAYEHGVIAITPAMDRVIDYFNHTRLAQLTYFKVVPGGPGGPHCELPEQETVPPETEPTATEPKATETKATEPKATEPKATEPKATEPKATEPKATEPKATEPKATEPKATEPKATEPKATQAPKPTEKQEDPAATKDSGNNIVITVLVICGLVIAGSGFALYWFVFKKKK